MFPWHTPTLKGIGLWKSRQSRQKVTRRLRQFASQHSLTEHCKKVHVKTGKFSKPFPCPECRRCGKPDHSITSASSWSSHVAMVHGRDYMPNLRTVPQPTLDERK